MDTQFVYTKKRGEFGRQCLFVDEGPRLMENVMPNKELFSEYIFRNPVNRSTQLSSIQAEHELNTITAQYDTHGMNHTEGGWPREVNPADEEQTQRFKKKIEKDDMYIQTVLQLTHAMEHCILQNNAVNIYEQYFEGVEPTTLMETCSARTVNVYRDQNSQKRPISHLSWSPDGGHRLAASYCNLEFQRIPHDIPTTSYIWEIENPNKPLSTLKPAVPIVCLEYNPKDVNSLVSGMFNGQVAFWDLRKGSTPIETSILEFSHRDPVYSVLWINSKSGTEFFSSSTDGQVKWWDTRKLTEPTETLIIDMVRGTEEQILSRALGCSCLEYEGTIPTRFMVGTENGCVISCNRKGKTAAEKIVTKFTSHVGPVYALQRNPSYVKNFLTIGDWMIRIWSEDCKESSVMWSCNHEAQLSDGGWSPTRTSVFFVSRMDGYLDAWDILQDQRIPMYSVKVCDYQLRCLRVHEYGQLVVVGNNLGTAYVVEFSENLATSQKNDKAMLTAMLDRESRREKILEARNRELRLKQKTKVAEAAKEIEEVQPSTPVLVMDTAVEQAHSDFFRIIEAELAAMKALAEAPPVEEEEEHVPEAEAPPPQKAVIAEGEGEGGEDMGGMEDLGGDMGGEMGGEGAGAGEGEGEMTGEAEE